MMCYQDAGLNGKYEEYPVGRKKVPSWKKICFQLEKFFSLTGNPVLGGHWHFPAFAPYFTLKGFSNTGKDVVKRFDRIQPFPVQSIVKGWTKLYHSQTNDLSWER